MSGPRLQAPNAAWGQLSLAVQLEQSADFENFYAGPNAEALQAVSQAAMGRSESCVYLWGTAGAGKTHLLQAACFEAARAGGRPAYVPLTELQGLRPDMLEGLERLDIVCVDDLQAVAGRADWEQALFDLYNRLHEQGVTLLAAATAAPGEAGLMLADLRSRLGWGLIFHLQSLSDVDKCTALQLRAHQLGMELPAEAARFLLRRCRRDMATLMDMLGQLDRASLAAQRRLTVPFIKAALGLA